MAAMRAALLRYEKLLTSIKKQLIAEHDMGRHAFARYERTIGALQQRIAQLEVMM